MKTTPAPVRPGADPAHMELLGRFLASQQPAQAVEAQARTLPAWVSSIRHRLRYAVRPWYVGAGLAAAGWIASVEQVPAGLLGAAGPLAAGLALAAPAAWLGGDDADGPRRDALVGRRRRYAAWCALAAGEWAAAADATGLSLAGLGGKLTWTGLLLGLPLLAAPYWRHYRIRPADQPAELPAVVIDESTVDELTTRAVTVWAVRVAGEKGALPETRLTDVVRIKGGWQATIVCEHPGSIDPDRFIAATRRIAAAYGVGVTDVSVELDSADAGQVQYWPGPHLFDLVDGIAVVGRYADEADWLYRFWGSTGPWHDLVCGATGSGKSEFVNHLLLLELHAAGLVVSWVGDPQGGQSYTDLVEAVDWFAPDIDRIRTMVQAAVKEMYRRNRQYATLRWFDETRQVWRRGQKTWRPTVADPLISITLDEAHVLLMDKAIRQAVADLCKMGRKCGIKVRLITQVPLLTELGGSMAIRDAVASGNVIVFRTANALSGPVAFNGAIPADPRKIPREWPRDGKPGAGETTAGMGYPLGVESRSVIGRAFYVPDSIDWIYRPDGSAAGRPGTLRDEAAKDLGAAYTNRRADLDQLPQEPTTTTAAGVEGTAVDAVLTFVAEADNGRTQRKDIVAGLDYSARAVGKALTELVSRELLVRVADGLYEITPAGREAAGLMSMMGA